MTTTIEFDTGCDDGDDDLERVLPVIHRHGGTLDRFVRSGPAGGCPNFVATFPDDASASAFFEDLHEGDLPYDPRHERPSDFGAYDHRIHRYHAWTCESLRRRILP